MRQDFLSCKLGCGDYNWVMKKWLVAMGVMGLVMAGRVGASEGTAEIYSLRGRPERCFLASILMQDGKYKVMISCRDLIFPPDQGVYGYVLWAYPADGGDPVKLGSIGVGKGLYTMPVSFSGVYVSEDKPVVRQGVKRIFPDPLMRGTMEALAIWTSDRVSLPTPTLEPTPTPVSGGGAEGGTAQTIGERLGGWFTRVLGVLFAVGILVVLAAVIVMSLGGRKKYPPGV